MSAYHHGLIIKAYREKRGMTQVELAAQWHGPGEGVSERYVQDVEAGKRKIRDTRTLRRLSEILAIPLWRFGLHEYDPFSEQFVAQGSDTMFHLSLDTAETLIYQTWYIRRTAPLPAVKKAIDHLTRLFEYYLNNLPPHVLEEKRFLRLYAQVKRLQAILYVERKRYSQALTSFREMLTIAREINEPATLALAHIGLGTELERANKEKDAVEMLEVARDLSFQTSKHIAALANAYLARAYASNKEPRRFERAIDTAQALAESLDLQYGDGTDFVFHSISGVLAERSYGYLDTGEPRKTLDMQHEITRQIDRENNIWLRAWIPLDWARAYFMINEIEESVKAGRDFLYKGLALQSPHVLSRAFRHVRSLEEAGFMQVAAVRDFREELMALSHDLSEELRIAMKEDNYSL